MPQSNDKFQNRSSGYTGPATFGQVVTPDDSTDLPHIPRWLTVEGGGALRVHMLENNDADNPVDVPAVPGQLIFIRPSRILATGTSATGIKAFW